VSDHVTILQPVSVVVVMTESFRENMVAEAEESIRQIDLNLERLAEVEADGHAEFEKGRLSHRRQELEWRVKEARSLKEGAELPFREVQALSEIKVGDDFQALLRTEIVVKDGQVVAIRRT
jgi:hypothetical protein